MLRIHQSRTIAAAKSYYTSGLDEGYYSKDGGKGQWFGKAAEMLGLSGDVEADQFRLLCENLRPDTGLRLKPRQDARQKVGYDLTFSAPKSVSILFEVLGDKRILDVFRESVRATMQVIEQDVEVRVRKGGVVATRKTSNMVYAEFVHHTARPTRFDGESESSVDPALHCHCYAFNTSYDAVESKFKAGEFFKIKHDAPYFQAYFHSKLAFGIASLGYGIQGKAFGFEVKGVGEGNIRAFSRRAKEIDLLAARLGVSGNAKAKDKLGALSRKRKDLRKCKADILREWRQRIDRKELNYHLQKGNGGRIDPTTAADLAISGCFERQSVVQYRRIVAEAMRASVGNCNPEQIETEMEGRGNLLSKVKDGFLLTTTPEVLNEESEIVGFLTKSRGDCMAMNPWFSASMELDGDQRSAANAMLRSTDRVFVIEGRAGSGKTTMMRCAIRGMEDAGMKVFTFAPTSQASHEVLKSEGFENSETIQQLLVNSELQAKVKGAVLWIDEAGLLSVREMRRLCWIASEQNARLILSGDRFQHHSVERGDALRLVVESGLVEVMQTRTIHRQRNLRHREAVRLIGEGQIAEAFGILDVLGSFNGADNFTMQADGIAQEYLASIHRYPSVLVVSPTHFEGRIITAAIRSKLTESGTISGPERISPIDRNRNLSAAERRQSRFIVKGDIIKFHQNAAGGFRRGAMWVVTESDGVIMVGHGASSLKELPHEAAPHYQVFKRDDISFCLGEKVRLLANAKSAEGRRLFNGSVHEITGWDESGNPILDGKHTLRKEQGILDHGYVTTSHASQGRTVSKVIVSQGESSFAASSIEQFYVSVSRSRDAVSIWMQDKEELLKAVSRTGNRMLAKELGVATDTIGLGGDNFPQMEIEDEMAQEQTRG